MKILIDKLNSIPGHSLSKKDIMIVLKFVPNDWYGVATVFHISSQLYDNSKWDRPVIQNQATYNILSRGLDKISVIKELLIELAVHGAKIYPKYGHRLNKGQRKKLEEIIEPYYEQIIKEINEA